MFKFEKVGENFFLSPPPSLHCRYVCSSRLLLTMFFCVRRFFHMVLYSSTVLPRKNEEEENTILLLLLLIFVTLYGPAGLLYSCKNGHDQSGQSIHQSHPCFFVAKIAGTVILTPAVRNFGLHFRENIPPGRQS